MKALTMADIVPNAEYERIRDGLRRRIIELKKIRRVALGPRVSVVFENTETMRFQVQEMMRIEHIEDRDAILAELEVYNDLLPEGLAIGATLLIELTQKDDIPAVLKELSGVEETVTLEFGPYRVAGQAEPGRSKEDKTSSVHYLVFAFSPQERQGLMDNAGAVDLVSGHPHYRHRHRLSEQTVASLLADLL